MRAARARLRQIRPRGITGIPADNVLIETLEDLLTRPGLPATTIDQIAEDYKGYLTIESVADNQPLFSSLLKNNDPNVQLATLNMMLDATNTRWGTTAPPSEIRMHYTVFQPDFISVIKQEAQPRSVQQSINDAADSLLRIISPTPSTSDPEP